MGVALLSTGLPALTYGFAKAGSGAGFASADALIPVVAGLALSSAFVLHSLRSEQPLLNVRLYANRAFAAASATTFCLGASLFGAMILLPLYFQDVRHDSVVRTGLLLMPQGLGAAFAMPVAGRLADRFGGGPLALAGVIVTAVSTLPLALVATDTPVWQIEASLLVRGLGIGIAIMPAMSAAYAVLRPEQIADATPQLTVIQRVGGSIGTAVLAVALDGSLRRATTLRTRPPRLPVRTGGRWRSPCSPWFRRQFSCRRSAGPEEARPRRAPWLLPRPHWRPYERAGAGNRPGARARGAQARAPPHARRPSAAQKP